ncbi:class I SAM-dependent methyltransferase [Thermodesulfobacteriota bacterium]
MEGFKAKLRPIAHPIIINLHQPFLRRRFGDLGLSVPHQIVWGSRGGGTKFLVQKVTRYIPLRNKRLLLIGVGFGPDLADWTQLSPGYIAGTEILNYSRAWEIIKKHFGGMRIEFFRTTGSSLSCFDDDSFEVVSSTAVLEHVQDVPALLSEVSRVLRPDGVATFSLSPLYFTFGGDHFSGNDHFKNGFNHVLLDEKEYMNYLDSIPYRDEDMADGRVWILQKLFSYLKPAEYVDAFLQYFDILFLRVHLSPKAIKFRKEYPDLYDQMVDKRGLLPTDPLVSGMEVFLKKKNASG